MSDDPARQLPYHQLSRWSGQMYVASMRAGARHLGRGFSAGVIVSLLARLCAPDCTTGDAIAPPAEPTRFGSINAMARSLDRPFETIRRQVHGLARDGLVTLDPRGVALGTDPGVAPRLVALLSDGHDLFLRLIEEFDALGVLPSPRIAPNRPLLPAILTTAFDVDLVPLENWPATLGDWPSMVLWAGIGAANVRHIVFDPPLSATYATKMVPDDMRTPVPLAGVARDLGMSYATAWRHALGLEERGLARRDSRGWIVGQAHYAQPAIADRTSGATHYILRRVGDLVAMGFDPATVATRYINGRPKLDALG